FYQVMNKQGCVFYQVMNKLRCVFYQVMNKQGCLFYRAGTSKAAYSTEPEQARLLILRSRNKYGYGIRNTQYVIRNTQYGIRKALFW
ncbi:MAG: hypothetical protein ACPGWR_26500, partial [Ardenticatenaceae bacterium]